MPRDDTQPAPACQREPWARAVTACANALAAWSAAAIVFQGTPVASHSASSSKISVALLRAVFRRQTSWKPQNRCGAKLRPRSARTSAAVTRRHL
jgi:hypothetical protein